MHAWANPFRVAMDTSLSSLYPGSFAARNPSFTYAYGGRRYLDPGRPEVRLLGTQYRANDDGGSTCQRAQG